MNSRQQVPDPSSTVTPEAGGPRHCSRSERRASRRRLWAVMGRMGLGAFLLVAVTACISGPLDPIVQEQEDPPDPTQDPTDGAAFEVGSQEASYAFRLHFEGTARL
jgi:hypothetical protein